MPHAHNTLITCYEVRSSRPSSNAQHPRDISSIPALDELPRNKVSIFVLPASFPGLDMVVFYPGNGGCVDLYQFSDLIAGSSGSMSDGDATSLVEPESLPTKDLRDFIHGALKSAELI